MKFKIIKNDIEIQMELLPQVWYSGVYQSEICDYICDSFNLLEEIKWLSVEAIWAGWI